MFRKLIPIAAAALVAFTGATAVFAAEKFVTIGSGAVTGVYYPTGGAIAKLVNVKRKQNGLIACVASTSGSKYNIDALRKRELDFAFVQADTQYMAYHGLADWNDKPMTELRSVLALSTEAVTLVVGEDTGIRSVAELRNKTICLGDPNSGNRVSAKDVLAAFNLTPSYDFRDVKLSQDHVPNALNNSRIDGFFFTVAHPNENMNTALTGKRFCRVVPITGIEKLLSVSPFYTKTTIDMSLYPQATNANELVETIGIASTLVTTEDTPDEVVYCITKEVMQNLDTLKKQHPALARLTPQSMLEGHTAPMHPGALKYFREAGLVK